MIARYTLAPMKQLWLRQETKFEYWLKVEIAALQARADCGELREDIPELIEQSARIDVARINELEAEFDHDMIAFIGSVQECLRQAGLGEDIIGEFHKHLSSYSIEDPALVLMLREGVGFILYELRRLREALRARSIQHKWDLMIARTHGQFAEPTTFGALLAIFTSQTDRSICRLQTVLNEELSEANMAGAVGIFGDLKPAVAERALGLLGLKLAKAESQILQRDRHAALLSAIAIAGAGIEQMCRTFWEMMRAEVRELQEPRLPNQRGSTAMSHKRNPILTERLMGIARILRANAGAGLENIATPEHRDISQSSVERHILPDSTALFHYMVVKATGLVSGLDVFPEQMLHNLDVETRGVWASQRIRNLLMVAGVPYDVAYKFTQQVCFEAVDQGVHLRELLATRPVDPDKPGNTLTAVAMLDQQRVEECFEPMRSVRQGVEYIFGGKQPR